MPGLTSAISAAEIAPMPEAKPTAASPPSRSAIIASNAATVGFCTRL